MWKKVLGILGFLPYLCTVNEHTIKKENDENKESLHVSYCSSH